MEKAPSVHKRPPRIFPGWWAVLAGTWLNFWGSAFAAYGFSALFKPISAELGFSRAATAVASGISRFEGGFLSPVVGWLVDRFGPRWVAVFGTFLFSLALALMYFVNSLWAFYLVWGVILGSGQNFSSGIPVDKAITNWFVKKRGLALSIRWIASGVLVLPLIAWSITNLGWRTTCLIGGVVSAIVGIPLVAFSIKQHRPEYYGLLPDGATIREEMSRAGQTQTIEKGTAYAAAVGATELTLRQALKTPAYWILMIAQAGYMIAHQALSIHVVPFLTDMGIDLTRAAVIMTFSGVIGIIARLVGGLVADRIKGGYLRFLFGGAILIQGIGILAFLLNQTIVMVYPLLILNYIGFGMSMVLTPMIWGRYFGRKAFGSIRGFSTMFTTPLVILSPIYTGWVYDTTGSYIGAFIVMAIIFSSGGVLMSLARPPKPPTQVSDIRQIV